MINLVNFLLFLFTSTSVLATSSPKQDWLTGMQRDLPRTLCQPEQYFMQCFQITEANCMEATSQYVKACLNNIIIALPPEINKEQGEYWGKLVGRCSFDLYEKFMQSKKLKKSACQLESRATP